MNRCDGFRIDEYKKDDRRNEHDLYISPHFGSPRMSSLYHYDLDRSISGTTNWTDHRRRVILRDGKSAYREKRKRADGTETGDGRPGTLEGAGRRDL